jgi:hypothetical protein
MEYVWPSIVSHYIKIEFGSKYFSQIELGSEYAFLSVERTC